MAKKNYNLLLGACALIAIVLAVGIVGYVVSKPQEALLQGEAEATEYRISGKVPGRIEAFGAEEGQQVHKGDTLVILDSPEIRSKIAEANAARAAAVALVNSYRDEITLVSPADGIVVARYPKVGELVGQGSPIMTVQDLGDMWFTFNIREDRLHSMKNGDLVTLRIPALDNREVSAEVYYLMVRESYATWRATKEQGEFDCRTFEVRVRPDAPVEGLRPGMSAIIVNR